MGVGTFWRSKVVIITGASSGIGAALAEHVAQRGAIVGLLGRNAERLEDLRSRLAGRGTRVETASADVTDADATRTAIEGLQRSLGPCDVLVASAGIHAYSNGSKFDPPLVAAANQVICTNVYGVINAFGAVLPGMVERRRGRVCAVASIAGLVGLPTSSVYSASKAAVLTLCRGLRVDLRPFGVHVTAVGPGFVDTPMMQRDGKTTQKLDAMPAADAAARIAGAIERGRAETFFPTRTWLFAWIASKLPANLYAAMWQRMVRKKQALKASDEW